MSAFEVIQPGAFTTVQDLGRYGYQKYGVSISGAMDRFALRVANLLVGNDEGEGVIEATIIGPKLKALERMRVAITGADLSPEFGGKPLPLWRTLDIPEGGTLSFGAPRSGCRAYLAVAGGIDFPVVMGSRSIHTRSNLGGNGRTLVKGDIIERKDSGFRIQESETHRLLPELVPVYGKNWQIRVIFGPQKDYFTRQGIETFLTSEYEITPQADRMGYRLKGPKIEHKSGADILTDATPPGSIQVPGDGMPIILLADGQTTGGYSKIATVISVDQDLLAQARPGEKVRFQKVTILEAHQFLREMEEKIQRIKKALIPV
ncbi:MAG TPA: biotin-dependent carboxyltransferase family protein [Thermodesulfobacteriota bacterium]|nr:biotin-dependent carboxyltransferase family protein [Thermodesulfobacteriota bacterium]